LGPSSVPIVVAQPDERHAKEKLLCWSGMTNTEHTFGSNKEYFYKNEKEIDFQMKIINKIFNFCFAEKFYLFLKNVSFVKKLRFKIFFLFFT